MKLLSLELENYRNHPRLHLELDPQKPLNYIIGANGLGKTNVLEAIYLLALIKSFRATKNEEIIQWGSSYSRIQGKFLPDQEDESPKDLEVFLGIPPQPQRVLKQNGIKTNPFQFIGSCQIVFFHPEDLEILYLGPSFRRRYLDIINLQINKTYYRDLKTNQKILKQRNALLKNNVLQTKPLDLEIWDEQFAQTSATLILERLKTIEYLQKFLTIFYTQISQGNEELKVHYQNSTLEELNHQGQTINAEKISSELLKNTLTQQLKNHHRIDLQAKRTLLGPHRDDIIFSINQKPLSSSSRGEHRSLLLALKLIELQFFKEKTQNTPLLLLDDVFSELDPNRQHMLLKAIQNHQTIIATTHAENFFWELPANELKITS